MTTSNFIKYQKMILDLGFLRLYKVFIFDVMVATERFSGYLDAMSGVVSSNVVKRFLRHWPQYECIDYSFYAFLWLWATKFSRDFEDKPYGFVNAEDESNCRALSVARNDSNVEDVNAENDSVSYSWSFTNIFK